MNSTECPFLFVLSYLDAKINISPQTTKDLREKCGYFTITSTVLLELLPS